MNVARVLVKNVHEKGFRRVQVLPHVPGVLCGAGFLSFYSGFFCEGRKLPAWELYNHTKVLGTDCIN